VTDVVRRPTSSVRARSRPRAVLGMWAWETALSFAGSLPAAALVRAAYGRHPDGDAPLWDPGALPLLGLLSREANGVRAATTTAALLLLFGAIAGLVPLAAMMISISSATRQGRAIGVARTIEAALRTFRSFGLVLALVGVGQCLVLAIGFLLAEGIQSWTQSSLGEALAQHLAAAVGAIALLGALGIGVVQDLARASVVRLDVRAVPAITLGARALRTAPIAVMWSWTWRAIASLAPVIAVGRLADVIGGRGGIALLALALLHQCVVVSRVALRASWLANAMRTVDRVEASEPLFAMRPLDEGAHLDASDR
jgi:hypothetical protein